MTHVSRNGKSGSHKRKWKRNLLFIALVAFLSCTTLSLVILGNTNQQASTSRLEKEISRSDKKGNNTSEHPPALRLPPTRTQEIPKLPINAVTVPSPKRISAEKEVPRNINIVTANHHFFGSVYERSVPNCKYETSNVEPMKCTFSKKDGTNLQTADVLLYHMPTASSGSTIKRHRPGQLLAGMSMEPGSYYRQQQDLNYLKRFDIRMYYNRTSEVPLLYSNEWLTNNEIFDPAVPTSEKMPKLVYMNSNCGAKNGRNSIVQKVMQIGDIKVDSYGRCLNNMKSEKAKNEIFSKYKFCIAMENSNEVDYVSEKLWQSLQAGCIPVYFGAPNIADFLPVPVSQIILNYADFGSPQALSDEMVRISKDDGLYNKFMEYKKLDPRGDVVLPGFRWLVEVADRGHSQCALCRYVAKILDARKDGVDAGDSTSTADH